MRHVEPSPASTPRLQVYHGLNVGAFSVQSYQHCLLSTNNFLKVCNYLVKIVIVPPNRLHVLLAVQPHSSTSVFWVLRMGALLLVCGCMGGWWEEEEEEEEEEELICLSLWWQFRSPEQLLPMQIASNPLLLPTLFFLPPLPPLAWARLESQFGMRLHATFFFGTLAWKMHFQFGFQFQIFFFFREEEGKGEKKKNQFELI